MSVAETDTERAPAQLRGRKSVIVAYGVLAVLGAAFFALSFQYDFLKAGDLVGPGLLPRVAGLMLALIGVGLILQEIFVGSTLAGDSGMVLEGDDAPLSRETAIKLVSVFGLITVSLLLTPVLGLIPSLALLVFVLTVFIEKMSVVVSTIVTVSAAVVAYLLFVILLQFPLPMGIFEGLL